MIISRTPLRISFAGGGSDIPSFYRQHRGAVITTAINKYVYIMVSRQFDGRIIAQYSKVEVVKNVRSIQNNLIREAMKLVGITGGIHVSSLSDVPAEGTGMGSSSSYVVGLLHALYAYQGKHVNARTLAEQACHIEIDILKKPIGKQDQYIAAFGGFNHIEFNQDDSVFVNPLLCHPSTKKRLLSRLLLFYTGLTRSSDPILAEQSTNMQKQEERRKSMSRMVSIADVMRQELCNNNLKKFGSQLDENWKLKTSMASGIETRQIHNWYKKAKRAGATGGKILGAGGGGFLLVYADSQTHGRIKKVLSDLTPLEFGFESQGSGIVFVD